MKWLKLWSEVRNNTKLLKLSPADRWSWIVLLCVASEGSPRGSLPSVQDVAIELRTTPGKASSLLTRFRDPHGLLDYDAESQRMVIHDWKDWQTKVDAMSAGAMVTNHKRWHVGKGKFDGECPLCVYESGSDSGGDSPGESGIDSGSDSRTTSGLGRQRKEIRDQTQSQKTDEADASEENDRITPPPRNAGGDVSSAGSPSSSSGQSAADAQGLVAELWDTHLLDVGTLPRWNRLDTQTRRKLTTLARQVQPAMVEHVFIEAINVTTPESPALLILMLEQHRDHGCGYGWVPGEPYVSTGWEARRQA